MILSDINVKPKFSRVFRYQTEGDQTPSNFLRSDLLNLQLFVTTSSQATSRIIESIRLDSIKITSFSDSNSAATVCLKWVGDRTPDVCYTGFCSAQKPFKKTYRPPKNSLAGYWTSQGDEESEPLFQFESRAVNTVSFLDLHVTVVYLDGATASGPSLSMASSFTGIGSPKLPSGDDTFIPVGLTQLDI
jgi:hypothetical protein